MGKINSFGHTLGIFTKRFTSGVLSLAIGLSGLAAAAPLFLAETAYAAGSTSVVTPQSTHNWRFTTTGDATGSYSSQPSTQILGSGSYELKSTSGKKGYLYSYTFGSHKLKNLDNISYSYYIASHTAGSKVAPSLSLITTINGTWTELKVEPTYTTDNPSLNTWHTLNAFDAGTKWYSTHDLKDKDGNIVVHKFQGVADLVSWQTLVALDSQAQLSSDDGATGVRFTVGQNSGGAPWANFDSFIDNVVINQKTYDFEPLTVAPCAVTNSVVTTDLSTWDLSKTRASGHNVLANNGLHIYTDGSTDTGPRTDGVSGSWNTDKAAGYYATDFALSNLGNKTIDQSIDYDATTGITPGLQLVTDFDNDGTADGILVGESIYGNNWWLSDSSSLVQAGAPHNGGGNGSPWYGTPNEWLAKFPNAQVKAIGYSLGSGIHGDGILKRISLGCTDYTFKLTPTAAPTSLKFNYKDSSEVDHTLACGEGINSSKPNQFHLSGSLNLNWTAPSGSVDGYQVLITYPNGDTDLAYQGANPWAWLQFNKGEGLYTYQVRSSNSAGVSDYSATCGIYFDTHSPVAKFTQAPTDNSTTDGNFHVEGTATDSVALKSANFDVRDASGWKAGCVAGTLVANYSADHKSATLSCDINTANLTEGSTYYVRIHAGDYAGYGSQDVAPLSIRHFTVDRTAPAAPTGLGWKNTNNVTVADSGATNSYSGTASWQSSSDTDHYIYKYWNDIIGNPYKVGNEYFATTTATSLPGDFNQGEGVHHFCVVAVDAAGNESACSATFTITYDKTKPTVALTNPTSFTMPFSNGPNVAATASDSLSGLKAFVIHVYNASNDSAARFCTATSDQLAAGAMNCDLSGLTEGTYYIKVGATDKAGNNQTISSDNFVVDKTGPTITVKPGYVGDLSSKVFSNVSFKLYDAHKADKYVINGYTSDFTNNTYSDANFQNIKSHLVEGTNTLTLYDVAGNSTTYAFIYDSTAPLATINGTTPATLYNDSTNINVHAIDTNYLQTDLYHSGDSTAFKTYTGEYFGLFWLPDGNYRMVVKDKAGHSTEYQFAIDKTAPKLAIVSVTKNGDGSYTITGTTDDPASDVVVTLDGTTLTPVTLNDHSWSATTDALAAGTSHTVTVNSTDAAGNAATEQTISFKAEPETTDTEALTPPSFAAVQFTAQRAQVLGASTTTPSTTGANNNGHVLGVEGQSDTASSSTDKKADTKDVKATSCTKFLGICWYYWIPIVLIVGYIIYRYFKAADENQTSTGK